MQVQTVSMRLPALPLLAQEYKANGLVKDVFAKESVMDKMVGTSGIAHVRYPTAGSSSAQEAQVRDIVAWCQVLYVVVDPGSTRHARSSCRVRQRTADACETSCTV